MARTDDDREARLLASRELGRAKRSIQAVQSLYVASAILACILFLLLFLGGAGPLVKAVFGAGFLLAIWGIWGVKSEPFLWTIGAAAFWTLVAGSLIAAGAARAAGIWFFVVCAWALGCWVMLPTTRRVKELLRAHPDLSVSRKMRGAPRRRR